MNRKANLIFLNRIVYILETILSFFLIAGIIISIPDLIKYFVGIVSSPKGISYNLFQEFLSHVLLLVIGLEFVLMMIAHSDSSVIYLMVVVIARKMLIYADSTVDLLVGVVAMLILFTVKKYLLTNSPVTEVNPSVFSAATDVSRINDRFNYAIDDLGFQTLGGLVYYLVDEQGITIESGVLVDDRHYIYQIEKASNGIIEEISIQQK